VDHDVLERAARLAPAELRTLDAIHIASALSLGADLLAFVSYDDRQRAAARKVGLPLVRP
jgi:predicted nucleic acid-binding protein